MADYKLETEQAIGFFNEVYPLPALPKGFGHLELGTALNEAHLPNAHEFIPAAIAKRATLRNSTYNSNLRFVERAHDYVMRAFFNQDVSGQDEESCQGTLFGAVNAVTHFETHRRSRGSSGFDELMNGYRAHRISAAHELAEKILEG